MRPHSTVRWSHCHPSNLPQTTRGKLHTSAATVHQCMCGQCHGGRGGRKTSSQAEGRAGPRRDREKDKERKHMRTSTHTHTRVQQLQELEIQASRCQEKFLSEFQTRRHRAANLRRRGMNELI